MTTVLPARSAEIMVLAGEAAKGVLDFLPRLQHTWEVPVFLNAVQSFLQDFERDAQKRCAPPPAKKQYKYTCSRCGGRTTKNYPICKACYKKEHDERLVKERAIVATGKCPKCGAGIRRNSSLAGWWQCEQFGADQFRKDPNKPACSWQTFTE